MTVKELIAELQKMPQDAEVRSWDDKTYYPIKSVAIVRDVEEWVELSHYV